MKLYTEEQVMDIILDSFISEYPTNANDILSNYTPIELPSDEEIEKQAVWIDSFIGYQDNIKRIIIGAQWMRDKIIKSRR